MAGKKTIRIPRFFEIGSGNTGQILDILKKYRLRHRRVVLLGDDRTFAIGGNDIAAGFARKGIATVRSKVKKSDDPSVFRTAKLVKKFRPDLVIGFGGGKVLDVAKLAAGRNRVKFISMPTILSNDGIASPVAVITNHMNIPISHLTAPPYGVIVDLDLIMKAPIRHLRAGVGDLISNLSAVFDARLAMSRGPDSIAPHILRLAETGPVRLLACKEKNIKSTGFLNCLTSGLIKSGLAMCMVGSSRPASGSEHKISHALDYLYPLRKTLHGEQVGIASLFTMTLQGNKFLKQVKRLYSRSGFPMKISRLGIDRNGFILVLEHARTIRPKRYTILEERKIKRADAQKIMKKLGI
jgi:glycerol-1-phosphate dehydrogenase [NAD(P)+]